MRKMLKVDFISDLEFKNRISCSAARNAIEVASYSRVGASVASTADPPAQRHPISGYAMGLVTWEPEIDPSVADQD